MDLMPLDVDEPQRAIPFDPHRSFAKLRRDIPDGSRLRGHHRQPASTKYSWPVISRASSEARKVTSAATSLGSKRPLRHCASTISASPSGVYHCIWRGVWTLPGTTQVTRILSLPRSRAIERVSPSIAALLV